MADINNNVRGGQAVGFGPTVVSELQRRINIANQAMAQRTDGPNQARHVGALAQLAHAFASWDAEHPLIMGLQRAHAANGYPTGTPYCTQPGTEQSRLLALVGLDAPSPDVDRTAAELVSAAFEDALKGMRQTVQDAHAQAHAALAERDRVAPFQPRALAAEAALIDAQAEARIATGERDQLQRQLDYLREQSRGGPERGPSSESTPRRTRVEGEPRLYVDADGKFEVGYRQGGKQRWKRFGEDRDAAITFRNETETEAVAA